MWMMAARLAVRAAKREWVRAAMCVVVVAVVQLIVCSILSSSSVAQAQLSVRTGALPIKGSSDPAAPLVAVSLEYTRGEPVEIVRVSAQKPDPLGLPGVQELPNPGSMYVSPALQERLKSDGELASRYDAGVIGVLPEASLQGPREMRAVIGVTKGEVVARGGAPTMGFTSSNQGTIKIPSTVQVGAPTIGVMAAVPVLWLLWVVISIGSVARDRRREALMVLGAPAYILKLVGAFESALCASVGVIVGHFAFYGLIPHVAPRIPIGHGVWPSDVRLDGVLEGAAAGGLILVSALMGSRAGKMKSDSRQLWRPPSPTARLRQALPLVLGLVLCLVSAWWRDADDTTTRVGILFCGFLLLVVGTFSLGMSLTGVLGDYLGSRGRGPFALISGRTTAVTRRSSLSVSGGLAMLVLISGLLLGFFPLLSEGSASARAVAADTVGRDTMMITNPPAGVSERLRSAAAVSGVAVVRSFQDPSTVGSLSASVECHGFVINDEGQSRPCDHSSVKSIMAALGADGISISGDVLVLDPGQRHPRIRGQSLDDVVLIQPQSGETEKVRTLVIDSGFPMSEVLTVGERAREAGNSTRPFMLATVLMLIAACLVAALSMWGGLVSQLLDRRVSFAELRILGFDPASMTGMLAVQTVLCTGPALGIAWVSSQVLAWSFLELNGGDVPLAVLPSVALYAVAAVTAPLAALLTYRQVEKASNPSFAFE